MEIKNKNILIVGLGKSGVAAARLAAARGAHVFVTDKKSPQELKASMRALPPGVAIETGAENFFKGRYDLVVLSPGVPFDTPALNRLRRAGVPIVPEFEFGLSFVSPQSIVAITGTNGKTTTTALVAHLLKTGGRQVAVGGNIGTPVCDLVPSITKKTILVLELSSYQLEAQSSFKPSVGLVLNLTPDHLKRHGTMLRYATVKARLFLNADSKTVAILNKNDAWCRWMGKRVRSRVLWFPTPAARALAKSISLPGEHNLENAMAAALAARTVGVSVSEIKKRLRLFRGVPHRIEPVRTVGGVTYFNDSKATNVDSTLVALKAMTQPAHLILGGEHKGSSYKPLLKMIKEKVRTILTIGEAAPIIKKDLKSTVPLVSCGTLKAAVNHASRQARAGEAVLLSPACASFDQFENFEHRGEVFRSLVEAL